MKIKVKYFASIREATSITEEIIETESIFAKELYEELSLKYHFQIDQSLLKLAVNEEYEEFNYKLKELDVVAFIPPVAGG